MRCSLLYRGVPIGSAELSTNVVTGDPVGVLEPSDAFAPLASTFEDAGRVLATITPPASGITREADDVDAEVFARVQRLCDDMELRDDRNAHVATDWINVFAFEDGDWPLVMVRLASASAAVGAFIARRPSSASQPAAPPD